MNRCTSESPRERYRCGLEQGHSGMHSALLPTGVVYDDDVIVEGTIVAPDNLAGKKVEFKMSADGHNQDIHGGTWFLRYRRDLSQHQGDYLVKRQRWLREKRRREI